MNTPPEEDLVEAINNLSVTQKNLLNRIIDSFEAGVVVTINPDSDLCKSSEFSEYFSNLFCVYHSITEHKFEKKSFEFAFKHASIASGYESDINNNPSHQGEDVTRGLEKISLKTEGEKSKNTFKISKFSEARFIANYKTEIEENEIRELPDSDPSKRNKMKILLSRRSNDLLPKLVEEFQKTLKHHLSNYDRIIALKTRANEADEKIVSYSYRLIEIPKILLEKSLCLSDKDFKPLKGNGGTSASVNVDGIKLYGVTLDGSVEKISITGIKISECITHAEFIVPVSV